MLKIVNQTPSPLALKTLGYDESRIKFEHRQAYVDENDTIEGADDLARRNTWRSSTAPSSRQRRSQHRLEVARSR